MKTVKFILGWLYGHLAILCAAAKSPTPFWSLAILCWKQSKFVASEATGSFPVRSLPLRLVDNALLTPHAEKKFTQALHLPNATVAAYCLIGLKRMGKLNSAAIGNISANLDDSILLKNGQFVIEISLKTYITNLLNNL